MNINCCYINKWKEAAHAFKINIFDDKINKINFFNIFITKATSKYMFKALLRKLIAVEVE